MLIETHKWDFLEIFKHDDAIGPVNEQFMLKLHGAKTTQFIGNLRHEYFSYRMPSNNRCDS